MSGGSVSGEPIAEFKLVMNEWNEWEEKAIFIPREADDRKGQIVVKTSSTLYVHDFNVQSDYVDQDVFPTLELEIEDDFLVAGDTKV